MRTAMSLLRVKCSIPIARKRLRSPKTTVTSIKSRLKCKELQPNVHQPDLFPQANKSWLRTATWCVWDHHETLLSSSQSYRCYSSLSNPYVDEDCFGVDLDKEMFEDQYYSCSDADFTSEDASTPSSSGSSRDLSDKPPHHIRKQSIFLLNYVQSCTNTGFLDEAAKAVLNRQQLTDQDMKTIEYLLQALINQPKIADDDDVTKKIQLLFQKVFKSELNLSQLACACMVAAVKKYEPDSQLVEVVLKKVEAKYSLKECLEACHKHGSTRTHLTSAIRRHRPDYVVDSLGPTRVAPPAVLEELYEQEPLNTSIVLPKSASEDDLKKNFDAQLDLERRGSARIPNVLSDEKPKAQKRHRERLKELHERWFPQALRAFRIVKQGERRRWSDGRSHDLGVFPFLCVLPDEEYIEIIINHLHQMSSSGELSHDAVYQIGHAVYSRYALKKYLTPESEERLRSLYSRYSSVYSREGDASVLRELWRRLEREEGKMLTESCVAPWQGFWKILVGNRLLEVMVTSLTVDVGGDNTHVPSTYFKNIPAVFNSYKPWGKKIYGMTIPHPVYAKLVKLAKGDFIFPPQHLPMVVPPLPWLHPNQGGFLCCPTEFVRRKEFSDLVGGDDFKSDDHGVAPTCDALNVLASVAWRINRKVLDAQLELFRDEGDKKLKIAPAPDEIPAHLKNVKNLPPEDRRRIASEYFKAKKLSNEMNSLHADALYKFSIANFFRDKLIWLPHNLDFRGRTYPTPPHFNYMGDDVSRSLFMFADGRPLGRRGLEWLKIHLVNLTGAKKYGSLQDRLDYADEMMEEIFDSADRPLEGRCWWKRSEEPWQTLAACMELAEAMRSPDPEKFVSHLPIYQDGSCNGLQHYAALGRDVIGAKQVNLLPSERPQDVYTGVAEIVEEIRKKDASSGLPIAEKLDGFVTRKVVKQTVMTTVYGVTRYGGALQIKKQLANTDGFPPDQCAQASGYLVNAIFRSISTIFTSATHIQKWLTDIASCMAKGGRAVEWRTTLGLLAAQPYFKTNNYSVDSKLQRYTILGSTPAPNVVKQCNAFPPNFVHSLDSTHMMLTALHCFHQGVTFSAVHDCYWTHASSVDVMNRLCREQFVVLHSQAILQQLADHLSKFLPADGAEESDQYISPPQRDNLRTLLTNIPAKGDFDLNQVKKSTFFFS